MVSWIKTATKTQVLCIMKKNVIMFSFVSLQPKVHWCLRESSLHLSGTVITTHPVHCIQISNSLPVTIHLRHFRDSPVFRIHGSPVFLPSLTRFIIVLCIMTFLIHLWGRQEDTTPISVHYFYNRPGPDTFPEASPHRRIMGNQRILNSGTQIIGYGSDYPGQSSFPGRLNIYFLI